MQTLQDNIPVNVIQAICFSGQYLATSTHGNTFMCRVSVPLEK